MANLFDLQSYGSIHCWSTQENNFVASAESKDLSVHNLSPVIQERGTKKPIKLANTWSQSQNGIISAGQDNGVVSIYEPNKLTKLNDISKHTSRILNSEFCQVVKGTNLLATGCKNGKVLVTDLKKLNQPTTVSAYNTTTTTSNTINTCIAWNTQVVHVLASGSTLNEISIWDLRQKKEWCKVKDTKICKWNPIQGLYLMTCNENTLKLFDLRNSTTKPLTEFIGHNKKITQFDWCKFDDMMALSYSEDDNKLLLWDLYSGNSILNFNDLNLKLQNSENNFFINEKIEKNKNKISQGFAGLKLENNQEKNVNDVFSSFNEENEILKKNKFIEFSKCTKGLILTNCNKEGKTNLLTVNMFSSLNYTKKYHLGIDLTSSLRKPKWITKTAKTSFGFPNKIVQVNEKDNIIHINENNMVKKTNFVTEMIKLDEDLSSLTNGEVTYEDYCLRQSAENSDEFSSYFYKILPLLSVDIEQNRELLNNFLNLSNESIKHEVFDTLGIPIEQPLTQEEENPVKEVITNPQGLQGLEFDNKTEKAEDFFGNMSTANTFSEQSVDIIEKEAEKKGNEVLKVVKNDKIERNVTIIEDKNVDDLVKKCLFIGEFEIGCDLLIKNKRYADALLMSTCGGEELWDKTVFEFLKNNSKNKTYLKLLKSVLNDDLENYIKTTEITLNNWKEVLLTITQYSKKDNFYILIQNLGDKLSNLIQKEDKKYETDIYKASILCFLISKNTEKVISCLINYHDDISIEQTYEEKLKFLTILTKKILVLSIVQDTTCSDVKGMKILVQAAEELIKNGNLDYAARFLAEVQAFELTGQEEDFEILNELFMKLYELQDKIITAHAQPQSLAQYIPQKWFPYTVIIPTTTIIQPIEEKVEEIQPQETETIPNYVNQEVYTQQPVEAQVHHQQTNIPTQSYQQQPQFPIQNQGSAQSFQPQAQVPTQQYQHQQQPSTQNFTQPNQLQSNGQNYGQQQDYYQQNQSSARTTGQPSFQQTMQPPAQQYQQNHPPYPTQQNNFPPAQQPPQADQLAGQQSFGFGQQQQSQPPTNVQSGLAPKQAFAQPQSFPQGQQQSFQQASPSHKSPRIPLNDGFQSTVGDPTAAERYGNMTTGNLSLGSSSEAPRRRVSSVTSEVSNYDHLGNPIPGPNTQNSNVFDPAHPQPAAQSLASIPQEQVKEFHQLTQKMQAILNSFQKLVQILSSFELSTAERKYLDIGSNSLDILKGHFTEGKVSPDLQVELESLAATVDSYNFNAANQLKLKITRHYWTHQKDWLKGFSQLISLAQKKYPGQ